MLKFSNLCYYYYYCLGFISAANTFKNWDKFQAEYFVEEMSIK